MSTNSFLAAGQSMTKRVGVATAKVIRAVLNNPGKTAALVLALSTANCSNPVAGALGFGTYGDGYVEHSGGPYYDPNGTYREGDNGGLLQGNQQWMGRRWAPPGYGAGYGPGYAGGGSNTVIREYRCKDRTGFFPNAVLGPDCRPTGRTTIIQQEPIYPQQPYVDPRYARPDWGM